MLGHGVGVPLVGVVKYDGDGECISRGCSAEGEGYSSRVVRRDKDWWMMWFLEGKMMMAHRRGHRWCGFVSRLAAAVS